MRQQTQTESRQPGRTAASAPAPHYTLQEAAHALGIGERALFADLRRRRILDNRNVPTWRYKAAGYFVEREHTYKHPAVGVRFYIRAHVTERGLRWLRATVAATTTA